MSYIRNETQSGMRRMTNSKKSNQLPGHEKKNDRCIKDEAVINRLKADHTSLNNGHLMEDLPVPECERCHSHALTVKHLFTDGANQASLRFRFFDGSNPNTL